MRATWPRSDSPDDIVRVWPRQYSQLPHILADNPDLVEIVLHDHLGGFDRDLRNPMLDLVNRFAQDHCRRVRVYTGYVMSLPITAHYAWLDFSRIDCAVLEDLRDYGTHPALSFEKFICSFNGTEHVGRQLLTAALHRFGWFDPECCSKNFTFTADQIDGHVASYVPGQHRLYRKFFLGDVNDHDFFDTKYSFDYQRFEHQHNLRCLEGALCRSFLHVVSETMATSYYPLVSEKFLYSVVTQGLFLAYAPPGWHQQLQQHFGFRLYDRLFDYSFDTIQDPVLRLISLLTQLSRFAFMSRADWRDLYELEQPTVEYNIDWYRSGGMWQRVTEDIRQ